MLRTMRVRAWKHPLLWAEASLWVLGIGLLVWAGWTWTDTRLYQARAQRTLATAAAAAAESGAAPGVVEAQPVAPGTPVARLTIPRLDVDAVVAEGTSEDILRRAVGHLASSADPGSAGNVVLAAHRDSFFRPLEDIRPGDDIHLSSPNGDASYAVQWTRVVEPSDVAVTSDAGYPALTLITCYPFRYVGSAPLRFIVRARRQADAAAPPE